MSAGKFETSWQFRRRHTSLGVVAGGVDLKEDRQPSTGGGAGSAQSFNVVAIAQAVQGHTGRQQLGQLTALDPTNEMETKAHGCCVVHDLKVVETVLADLRDAGGEQGRQYGRFLLLGHGDESDTSRITPGASTGRSDLGTDGCQIYRDAFKRSRHDSQA